MLLALSIAAATAAATNAAHAQQRRAPASAEGAPDRMVFELATNDPEAPRDKQIRWVSARGGIVRDTPKDFDEFLKKHDITGLTIYFDSSGGSINGGLELGERLRKLSAKVSIGRSLPVGTAEMVGSGDAPPLRRHQLSPNSGQCNSSCAYAFLGGVKRTIPASATYGVHMFWPSDKAEKLHQQNYVSRDIENAQRTASRIVVYLQKMDVDLRLFELASTTPHKGQIRRLTPKEITDLRVASIEHATPLLAREGNWGLLVGRSTATLVTGGPLPGAERAGANFQLEFTCNATRGFHNARLELSVSKSLPEDRPVALRRVLLVSGTKDAVIAISGKDIRAMPATFNRLTARNPGAWIAKAGTVVSEVVENAVTRPSDGLSLRIDEGNDSVYSLKLALGNLPEQYRPWVAACDGFRARASSEPEPRGAGQPER
ncbi:MAG TPA: hypothetical protein PK812_05680 [Beijerinckiaceae bacterium]|nr:hypothetical protein [Beijerinckiaceae bacterium]